MDLQNIGAKNSGDTFYRYKMPKMITKIEGTGKGKKTNIVNMVDIAKALARPASYTTKYFGYKLGTISEFDKKTGVSIVNGTHDTAKLAELLDNFIDKYVQCYKCKNPETEIIINKKTQMIQLNCAACGFISDVKAAKDKLASFKIKHPPEQTKNHAVIISNSPDANALSDDSDGNVQWETDTSEEAARRRAQEQLSAVTADMVMIPTIRTKDNDKIHEELVEEIRSNMKKGSTAGLLESLDGTPEVIMNALFEALFQVEKGFAKEVDKKKNYLAVAAQKEGGQIAILRALDEFCRKSNSNVVKEVALVMESLYDADILEEEHIVKWYEEGLVGANSNSDIWKYTKPFIDWLHNAEYESESD